MEVAVVLRLVFIWIAVCGSVWAECYVSANFLLFGTTVQGVTEERLMRLSRLTLDDGRQAISTIYIPIFDEDRGQYAEVRTLLDRFSFRVICTTPMSADKDITSLDEAEGRAGVEFLKERVLIAKKMESKVLTGALLFPELEGDSGKGIWPLDARGDHLDVLALNEDVKQRVRLAVGRMQEVADFAAQQGIVVLNEYINHWEICGGNTMSSALAFALEVDRPNFGILSDISHEVMQGQGPYLYAGLLQLAKESKIPLYFQLSEPGRGDIVHSWIPFDELFGFIQALDLIDEEHPIDIEIFDAIPPFNTQLKLTRKPFLDSMQVLLDGALYTHQRYIQLPLESKKIPVGAFEAACRYVAKEREEVYH